MAPNPKHYAIYWRKQQWTLLVKNLFEKLEVNITLHMIAVAQLLCMLNNGCVMYKFFQETQSLKPILS